MRKAVILAGGTGSRLSPITRVINKHLLPVGYYPMIYWSIYKVREAGLSEVLIITSRNDLCSFYELLGKGEEFGVNINYKVQPFASGIADALSLAKDFVEGEKFLVLLGDNLFEESLEPYVRAYEKELEIATIFLKEVQDTTQYGIAMVDQDTQKIISIQEKPNIAGPAYCVTGIYMYDYEVFKYIDQISQSTRGELEITDVNRLFIQNHKLAYHILEGWWIDAGTHESLFEANQLFHKLKLPGVSSYG